MRSLGDYAITYNILDNAEYDLYLIYTEPDYNFANNWWGTTDTDAIDEQIYDFNDDFNLGTVTYLPILTKPDMDIVIDESAVSDAWCDVNSTQSISFHASWENGPAITDGIIYVNGTGYAVNSTGWVSLSVSSSAVRKQIWTVTGVNCSGITNYTQTVSNPNVIWDRVVVQGYSVSDSRANVGDNVTVDVTLVYDYDDTAVIDGSVSIHGKSATVIQPTLSTSVSVNSTPIFLGVNPTTNKIYIAHRDANIISVIDGSTDSLVSTIPVGNYPWGTVGINPNTNRIYVANVNDDTVSVIDGSTDSVIATIPVGNVPRYLAVNSITNKIYVPNAADNTVSVIDGASNTVSTTISVGNGPSGAQVNLATNRIYVVNVGGDTVSVINGTNDSVIATVSVGDSPNYFKINPVTNKVYIGNYYDDTISVLDGNTNTVTSTLVVGDRPRAIGINVMTNKIYVVNYGNDSVSIIDGESDIVTSTVQTGREPICIAINTLSNRFYVSNSRDDTVTVLDCFDNSVLFTFEVGDYPFSLEINDVTNIVYVGHENIGLVSIIEDNGGLWRIIENRDDVQTEHFQSVKVKENRHDITQVNNEIFSIDLEWVSMADWPMFQYDSRHTSYSTSTSPTTNNTIWELSNQYYSPYLSPVISDGRIFIGRNVLNFSTGSLLWTAPSGEFSGTESAGSWAVHNDIALLGLVHTRPFSYESYGVLYALNTSTGNEIWNYEAEDVISTSPVVYDGRVYIGDEDAKHVICLNVTNGDELWNYTTPGWITGTVAVSEGKVYAPTGSGVISLDASDGEKIWETSINAKTAIAVYEDNIYFGRESGEVYALNASSGATIWSYSTGSWIVSSPAMAYERVYIGSSDNNFYCLNASNGELLWSYTTEYQVKSSPAVANNVVYFGSGDNKIYALSALSGNPIWKYDTGGAVHTSPAIADGKVIAGNGGGKLYSFGPKVIIDSSTVSRVSVGTTQTVYLHASWDNGADVSSGNLFVNGTGYAVNSTGWIKFQTSSSVVDKKTWIVTGLNCSDVTDYSQAVSNPRIIWDRIYCVATSVSDNRVNVGDNVNIDFTLQFEFDDSPLIAGEVTIESASASHQGNGVWRITDTEANVTANTYDEFTTSNNSYGIIAVNGNSQSETIIWDRVKVSSYSVSDNRVNVADDVTIDVTLLYEYDNSPVTDGSVSITGTRGETLPTVMWNKTFGGSGSDYGKSVQQTTDGGYIIAGVALNSVGSGDYFLVKTDSDGNMLWNQTYGGSGHESGESVQQTTDGGYIIAGYSDSYGAGEGDVYLVKTDSEGIMLWNRTYGGNESEWGYSVQQTIDGGYIIVGFTTSFGVGGTDVYLIKTDPEGILTWNNTFSSSSSDVGSDVGNSVQQTTDGGYIIVGKTWTEGEGRNQVYLIKTNSSGHEVWNQTIGGSDADGGYSVRETRNGGYIIAGVTEYSDSDELSLILTDAAGNLLWRKAYDGTGYARPSVQITADGGYAVVSVIESGGGGRDVYLLKTDSNGVFEWDTTFGGSNDEMGYSVQQTSDGGYVIAGYSRSYGAGDDDFYIIKTTNKVAASHQGNGVWRITESSGYVQSVSYNVVEVSGNAPDVTAVNQNNLSTQLVWDQIFVYYETLDNGRVDADGDIEYQAKAVLEYDNHPLGSEDSLTANTGNMTWDAENSWYEVNHSETIVKQVLFQISSGYESTYGITAVSSNQSNPQGIWDRVEIIEKGAIPSVLIIGGSSTVWFRAKYQFDDSEFNDTYGVLYVNGSAHSWNPTENRWENTIILEDVGVYSYQVSGINDTLYGLTEFIDSVGGMIVTYNPLPVVEIDSASVTDGRSNVNTSQTIFFHASWGNGSDITSGIIFVNGIGYSVNSTGWISFQSNSDNVLKKTWTVTDVNCSSVSSYVQNALDPTIIWDRIVVQGYSVSNSRVNVNETSEITFSLKYEYDNSSVLDGTVSLNGEGASHLLDGLWIISDIESLTIQNIYDTVSVNGNTHGITEVDQSNQTVKVVWDQLEIATIGFSDDRINVGEDVEVRYSMRYEYDDSLFTEDNGSLTILGSAASFDWENGWWARNITQSSIIGSTLYDERDISVTDNVYNLSSVKAHSGETVITDQILIYWEALDDDHVNVGNEIEWHIRATLAYDNHVLGSGDILSSNFGILMWDASREWWKISHSENSSISLSVGDWNGTETTYGITALTENVSETIGIWDQIHIIQNGVITSETQAAANHLLWIKAVYQHNNQSFTGSNGQLFINGTSSIWNNSRWELNIVQEASGTEYYQVTGIQDTQYGLTTFKDSVGPIAVIKSGQWSIPLQVTLGESFSDVTIGVSETATRWFDAAFDEFLPPLPISGVAAYLWDSENPASPIDMRKLITSIKSINYPARWILRVLPIGLSGECTISWDNELLSSISDEYSIFMETPTGDVNMRIHNTYTWSANEGEFDSFEIVVESQSVIRLELQVGWNMVSLQVNPYSPSAASVLSQLSFYQLVTWTGSGYVSASRFDPGVGYWLLVLEDATVEIRGSPLQSVDLSLSVGWNMVGGPNQAVNASSVFPGFYQLVTWNGNGYVASDSFEPGKGYWALVLEETQITLPPP